MRRHAGTARPPNGCRCLSRCRRSRSLSCPCSLRPSYHGRHMRSRAVKLRRSLSQGTLQCACYRPRCRYSRYTKSCPRWLRCPRSHPSRCRHWFAHAVVTPEPILPSPEFPLPGGPHCVPPPSSHPHWASIGKHTGPSLRHRRPAWRLPVRHRPHYNIVPSLLTPDAHTGQSHRSEDRASPGPRTVSQTPHPTCPTPQC